MKLKIKVACGTWKRRFGGTRRQGFEHHCFLGSWRGLGDAREGFTEEILPQ